MVARDSCMQEDLASGDFFLQRRGTSVDFLQPTNFILLLFRPSRIIMFLTSVTRKIVHHGCKFIIFHSPRIYSSFIKKLLSVLSLYYLKKSKAFAQEKCEGTSVDVFLFA